MADLEAFRSSRPAASSPAQQHRELITRLLHSQAGRGCASRTLTKAEEGLPRDRCVAPDLLQSIMTIEPNGYK